MAAQSPSSSSPIKAVASALGNKAPAALRQPGVSKSDVTNEVTTDQQWLEESQQAWAEQRAKEQELARAEKLGDRVLQLLEGEQPGGVVGESLILAQAKPAEEERKAVPPPKDDDGGGYWWPALGLGLLGAGLGHRGGAAAAPAPAPGPDPDPAFVPGNELLVYTNELGNEGGDRQEVGSTDTNTDEGPYQTIRVQAFDNGDTGLLDDGSSDSLYVEFDDRNDLSLDVWAQGSSSEATADIWTDSAFNGEISVIASGANSAAELYLSVNGASNYDNAEMGGTMSVEASGRNADAYAYVDVYSVSADAIFSVDLSVATSERYAVASADIYVEAAHGDANMQGNVDVLAQGHDSSAEANIYVSGDYAYISGDYSTASSGEDSGSDTWGAAQWSAVAADQNTTANLYADINVDNTASLNLDLTAQASYGGAQANVTLDIDAYHIDLMGAQTWSGNYSSSDSGFSVSEGEDRAAAQFSSIADHTDANSDLNLNMSAENVYLNADFTANAEETGNSNARTSTNATVNVDIDVQNYAQLGGDWSFTVASGEDVLGSTDTLTGSVGEDMTAADWTASAAGDTAYAGFFLDVHETNISGDFDLDMTANVSVLATDGAGADAYITLNDGNLNYLTVQGHSSWSESVTSVIHSADGGDSVGEDTTVTFAVSQAAADWTTEADSGGTSYLDATIDATGNVNMQVNLGATAGDDAFAQTVLSLTGDYGIDIAGSVSGDVVYTLSSSDYVAYTENVHGEDSTQVVNAASWEAVANGHHGEAYLSVDISSDNLGSYDVRVAADLTSVASATESTSDISVDIYSNGFVEINGGYSSVDTWTSGDLSGDTSVDLWTRTSTEYAADWQATASGVSAEALIDVEVSADSIELLANQTITASGTDAYAHSWVTLSADGDIHVGGEWTTSGGEEFGVTSDTTFESENAAWTVTASGTGSESVIDFGATTTSSGDIDLDVNVSVTASGAGSDAYANLTASADTYGDVYMGDAHHAVLTVTATGGGEAYMDLSLTGDYMDFSGDFTVSASGDDSLTSVNVGMNATNVDYVGDITATAASGSSQAYVDVGLYADQNVDFSGDMSLAATGSSSHVDLVVDVSACNDVHFTSDVTVTASGSDSEAHISLDLTGGTNDADEHVLFDGDTTLTASGSNSDTHMDLSMFGEDLTYQGDITLTASGSDSHGQVTVDIQTYNDADNTITYSGDTTFEASGANSLVSTDFFLYAQGSLDYTGDITLTASGSNSDVNSDFGLVSAIDANYSGDITVQVGGESGLDSDAVMHFSVDALDDAGFHGVVTVTADGADNSATLFIDVNGGGYEQIGGELNVSALDSGVSTVIVTGEDFYADMSLDADQNGEVNVSVSGFSIDSNIDVWTDNSGQVNLTLDFVVNSSDSAITAHGAGGEFNLVLESGGFNISVDLAAENYGGTFNLKVENPIDSTDACNEIWIGINGFDVTGPDTDSIYFGGDAFNGLYVDATDVNGTVDAYDNVYTSSADFFTDANTALDGSVDYFFGVIDGNGYLAVDGDGEGIDYVIELVGVTAIDWSTVLSQSGQYVETVV